MKLDHIALYVNDLETARTFFIHYFEAASNKCTITHAPD